MATGRPHARSLALRLLGLLLAPLLLWWTVSRTAASPLQALAAAHWPLVLGALLCVGMTHVLGAWRWGLSLAVQGVPCTWFLLWRLTLAGTFLSQLIPGAVSGDVLKLACLSRQHPGKGAEIVMSGLIDRILGVTGLFLAGTLGGLTLVALQPHTLTDEPVIGLALLVVTAGGLSSLLALLLLLHHRLLLRLRPAARLADWLASHLPQRLVDLTRRLCAAAASYASHPGRLVAVLALSVLIHALLGAAFFLLGRALGEHAHGFGTYFLAMQLGNAVTLVPATPGGLGLRDAVQAAFFQSLSGSDGMALLGSIPVIHSLLVLFWALLGAIALASLPAAHTPLSPKG
ncbi:MAG: lysylphosphatidylglycerol synthase transmembrane domain-containing protein [Oligosphaeraceae bacterium]